MGTVTLQFQGVKEWHLPALLAALIALVLAAWGAWQIVQGQRQRGLASLAAAFGPAVFAPVMVSGT